MKFEITKSAIIALLIFALSLVGYKITVGFTKQK